MPELPGDGRGHRRRRHRLRVRARCMADMGTEVTILEALPKILPGCDDDVTRVGAAVVQEAGHRRQDRRAGHRPRAQEAAAARPSASATARRSTSTWSSCRSAAAPTPTTSGLDGTGVAVDDRGFVEVDERCRTGEPGVWSVGDCIATPALAHVGLRRGHPRHQGHPRRGRRSRSTTRNVPWAHLLPPRGRLRRPLRGRPPRRPASTSSPPSTAGPATAGR